ncbi:MAG: trigger factor [Nitrospirae bacterium]|nr:trigger factor [Nitrospirota bacterium]
MKIEIEKLPECKQQFKIEVSAEEVDRQFEITYKELGRETRVDGFRQGKVPLPILKKRFREVAASEALKKIVSVAYTEAVKEKNIFPLGDPDVKVGEELPEEKKPFSFQVTIETWPDVKVKKYKGLSLERERIEISNEEIEAVLEMKREENADFLPVEGRPVQKDDWVVIDVKSFLDEKPFQSAEGYLFRLGSGVFPPEFEEKLIGKLPEADEEQEIEVPLPEGKSSAKLLYRVKLKGIKERRLLIVDDEFARDLGEFNSLAELREDIKNKLEARAREEEEGKLQGEAVDLLIKENEMELPSRLVEEQLDHLMLVSRASDEEEGKNELREKLRPLAIKQVKSSLILEEISRRENIVATEEEIKKEAEESKISLTKENREDLAHRIKRRKTLDFLINQAEVKEKEKPLVLTPDQVRMLMPQEKKFRKPGGGRIIVP